MLAGGERAHMGGELEGGYYVQPTVFRGHNRMRIFQEEIFGPVVSVTTFKTEVGRAGNCQRHAVRPRRGPVEPRRQSLPSPRTRHPGRARVDQLLPRLSGARGVWRLQAIGHRSRNAQHDARPLSADQEPAGELQPEEAGLLLGSVHATGVVAPGANFLRVPGARSDAYRVSASDEQQRNRENWPRPFGLRRKSGHTSFSPSTVGPPQPSGSASSGRIFARNAIHSSSVNRP